MAMNDDTDYPRLTPPDDRYPSSGNLFRSANDLTGDQFDLLAAAWSENALPDDSLAEMEALFVSDPSKKASAETFRQLRLMPYNDVWDRKKALLRTTPAAKIVRRAYFVTMAAAAVILVLLTLKPFAEKQPVITAPVSFPEVAVVSEPEEPVPPVVTEEIPESAIAVTETSATAEKEQPPVTEREQTVKATPVRVNARTEAPVITSGIDSRDLLAVNFNEIPASVNIPEKEENWLMKGIAGLAKTPKKEKTPVDGYIIAKSCIKGINSVFGADLELEKIVSEEGDTKAVVFNSSLLSFSAPVKKSSQ